MRKRTVAVFITFHHLSRSASYTGLAIIALAVVTLSSLIFAHATVGFVNLLTRKSCLEMYAFCAASAVIWNSTVAFIDYVVSNTALTPEGCFRARAQVQVARTSRWTYSNLQQVLVRYPARHRSSRELHVNSVMFLLLGVTEFPCDGQM